LKKITYHDGFPASYSSSAKNLTKEYHDVISVYAHARNMEFEEALDIAGVFPISI